MNKENQILLEKLKKYFDDKDAKSIGETFIKFEQNYSDNAKKINQRLFFDNG